MKAGYGVWHVESTWMINL